ncbi:unnamed protein product [Brassica rapa]|uniref:Uncharacterized protein n=1 Tax=Brassica campestris TaxID=3711 RepID=A0A8D9GL32_BRACM|nr:unnamed protein product [Brassica rapa]
MYLDKSFHRPFLCSFLLQLCVTFLETTQFYCVPT